MEDLMSHIPAVQHLSNIPDTEDGDEAVFDVTNTPDTLLLSVLGEKFYRGAVAIYVFSTEVGPDHVPGWYAHLSYGDDGVDGITGVAHTSLLIALDNLKHEFMKVGN